MSGKGLSFQRNKKRGRTSDVDRTPGPRQIYVGLKQLPRFTEVKVSNKYSCLFLSCRLFEVWRLLESYLIKCFTRKKIKILDYGYSSLLYPLFKTTKNQQADDVRFNLVSLQILLERSVFSRQRQSLDARLRFASTNCGKSYIQSSCGPDCMQ